MRGRYAAAAAKCPPWIAFAPPFGGALPGSAGSQLLLVDRGWNARIGAAAIGGGAGPHADDFALGYKAERRLGDLFFFSASWSMKLSCRAGKRNVREL